MYQIIFEFLKDVESWWKSVDDYKNLLSCIDQSLFDVEVEECQSISVAYYEKSEFSTISYLVIQLVFFIFIFWCQRRNTFFYFGWVFMNKTLDLKHILKRILFWFRFYGIISWLQLDVKHVEVVQCHRKAQRKMDKPWLEVCIKLNEI